MNEKMYEALEVCLHALETGVDIEAALKLYPQLADELRPLLEASIPARSLAATSVPQAAIQRGRARVLARANELRKGTSHPRRGSSFFAFPRLAVSLAIALVFLLSGTGLVSASSAALPGDHLYPVKRSWEDLRLLFVFSPEKRQGLESDFEQERLDEISDLLTEGRKATIAFAGLVTAQNILDWEVSGIKVIITPSTRLPADPVAISVPVMVIGHTNAQGFVEADTVEVLGPGVSLPPLEPSRLETGERETPENQDHGSQENETENNVNATVEQQEILTYKFKGVVESMNGNLWTINGQQVQVEKSEKSGKVSVGSLVEFEGYYSNSGQFIVTKIDVQSDALLKKDQLNSSGKDNSGKEDKLGSDSGGNGSGKQDSGEDDPHEGESD